MTFLHVHPVINIAYILYTILWSFLFTQFIHMNTLRIIILIIIASLQAFIYIELGLLLLCWKLSISYTDKNSFQWIVTFKIHLLYHALSFIGIKQNYDVHDKIFWQAYSYYASNFYSQNAKHVHINCKHIKIYYFPCFISLVQ